MRSIGHTLAQVARLSFPYFRSEDRWAGRGLLGVILAIELGQVGIAVDRVPGCGVAALFIA